MKNSVNRAISLNEIILFSSLIFSRPVTSGLSPPTVYCLFAWPLFVFLRSWTSLPYELSSESLALNR